jgi:hypothetical protein
MNLSLPVESDIFGPRSHVVYSVNLDILITNFYNIYGIVKSKFEAAIIPYRTWSKYSGNLEQQLYRFYNASFDSKIK